MKDQDQRKIEDQEQPQIDSQEHRQIGEGQSVWKGLIKDIFNSETFSKESIFNHWRGLLMIVIIATTAISLRYSCEKKLARIESLNKELLDKRFEALTRSSELIGIGRPSEVKKLINKKGIEIEESDKPAYILND